MSFRTSLATVAAVTLVGTMPLAAQNIFTGVEAVDDRIEDIEDDTRDLLSPRERGVFGSAQTPQGWAGSVALSATADTGNSESFDASLGARLTYRTGQFTNYMGFGLLYSEADGSRSTAEAFAIYDGVYDLGTQFYVFGTARYNFNDFGTYRHDAFVGVGPGFRVFNTEDLSWRVQAGPGVRYLEDQDANDTTEVAGIASSRLFMRTTETSFVTNDTDILFSDESVQVYNDLGVNFRMTDMLSTRVFLRTDWTDSPAPGFEEFDNSVGLALVATF